MISRHPGAPAPSGSTCPGCGKSLGDDERELIKTVTPGYVLDASLVGVDVDRFRELAAQARAALPGDPEPARDAFDAALSLWRGPPLSEFEYRDFARPAALQLAEEHAEVRAGLAEAEIALGNEAWGIGELQSLVDEHPYRERLRAALITGLYRAGRQADALEEYQRARKALGQDLGLEPSPELRELEERVLMHDQSLARHGSNTTAGLPARLSSFVGRRSELESLQSLLNDRRLVTLVGPPGVGKSSLAVEAGTEWSEARSSPAQLVELAPAATEEDVAYAAMRALGLGDVRGRSSLESLTARLQSDASLLILDNCEQVVEGAGAMAAHLTSTCPDLTIVATSRLALQLPGEFVMEVPPLDLATGDGVSSDAAGLFVARAAEVLGGNAGGLEAQLVETICRNLDGIPLAIELAAARLRAATIEQLAERLEEAVFAARRSGGPPHHRTLTATFDWSVARLSPAGQVLFRRLGLFEGPFRLESARSICSMPPLAAGDIAALLGDLVEASLVAFERGRGLYRMLEPTRQYALRLLDDEQLALIASRFQNHYVARAREYMVQSEDTPAAIVPAPVDLGSFRAAHRRALAERSEDALVIANSMGRHPYRAGRPSEALGWVEPALEQASSPTAQVVHGYRLVAGCRHLLGDIPGALEALEAAEQGARDLDETGLIGQVLTNRGILLAQIRGDGHAVDVLREAASLLENAGAARGLRLTVQKYITVFALGAGMLDVAQESVEREMNLAFDRPDYADELTESRGALALARGSSTDALDLFRRIASSGTSPTQSVGFATMAALAATEAGEIVEAEEFSARAMELVDEVSNRFQLPWVRWVRARALLLTGNPRDAIGLAVLALQDLLDDGGRAESGQAIAVLADAAVGFADRADVAVLDGAADAALAATRTVLPPRWRAAREERIEASRRAIGDQAHAATARRGAEMTLEQVLRFAGGLLPVPDVAPG